MRKLKWQTQIIIGRGHLVQIKWQTNMQLPTWDASGKEMLLHFVCSKSGSRHTSRVMFQQSKCSLTARHKELMVPVFCSYLNHWGPPKERPVRLGGKFDTTWPETTCFAAMSWKQVLNKKQTISVEFFLLHALRIPFVLTFCDSQPLLHCFQRFASHGGRSCCSDCWIGSICNDKNNFEILWKLLNINFVMCCLLLLSFTVVNKSNWVWIEDAIEFPAWMCTDRLQCIDELGLSFALFFADAFDSAAGFTLTKMDDKCAQSVSLLHRQVSSSWTFVVTGEQMLAS